MVSTIAHFTNSNDGVEAIVEDCDNGLFKITVRDTDADETVGSIFKRDRDAAVAYAFKACED